MSGTRQTMEGGGVIRVKDILSDYSFKNENYQVERVLSCISDFKEDFLCMGMHFSPFSILIISSDHLVFSLDEHQNPSVSLNLFLDKCRTVFESGYNDILQFVDFMSGQRFFASDIYEKINNELCFRISPLNEIPVRSLSCLNQTSFDAALL